MMGPRSAGDEDGLLGPLGELAERAAALTRRAVAEYAPLVEDIVRSGTADVRRIEHTLDGLLDFCFDAEALLVYKKLCRHYYPIDPLAAADYVRFYREMWDADPA